MDGAWLISSGLLGSGDGRRTGRDWVVDSAIFTIAVGSGAFVLASSWHRHAPLVAALDIALGGVACVSLWQRRVHPLAVALIAVTLSAVSALAAMATLPAVFNAAIRLSARQIVFVMALAVAGTAIFPALYASVDGHGYAWQVAVGVMLTLIALGWGLFVRAQRNLLRTMNAESQRDAREAERRRIAREMHDVLAHRLSLLSVHAGALENGRDRLPPAYRETATVIRDSAHKALAELRDVIGLLRDESSDGTEPPTPTLAEIPALVQESRAAGLAVHYREQPASGVPESVGRTAYRTVQEGLTNARKHAGDASIDVTVAGGPPLVIELVSHGSAATRVPGARAGLLGLAERVALAGGAFRHGPDGNGNFVLWVSLPW